MAVSNPARDRVPARPALSVHALRRETTRARLSLTAGLRHDDPITVALFSVIALSAYFLLLPRVDLEVSALFQVDGGFPLAANPLLIALRASSTSVLWLLVLGLVGEVAVGFLIAGGRYRLYTRRAIMLLCGLALGPGLIVNGLLKSLWGRARPIQIEGFGGDAAFTGAWQITRECARNCSFVSGEASSAAWMVAVILLMTPPEWRRWALPCAVAYGVALSLNRVAFGGHFLSDILLSWAITALVMAVLHRLLLYCPRMAGRVRRTRRLPAKGIVQTPVAP